MLRTFMPFLMFFIAGPAYSQADNIFGKWVVRSHGQAVMIIDVPQQAGPQVVTISAPEEGLVDKGHTGVGLGGAAKTTKFEQYDRTAANLFAISTTDPTDVIILTLVDDGLITLAYKKFPWFEPILLSRAGKADTVGNSWSSRTEWKLDEPWPDNAAVTELFYADQAMRRAGAKISSEVAEVNDRQRRKAVQELLDAGKVRSANDFYHAAFIFQHGEEPRDFLTAHALAVVSTARGRRDATWIAAATLDRYLSSIGQKQIYGTQYTMSADKPVTQEPYDRDLLSDALRTASGVPNLAEQEKRVNELNAAAAKSTADPKIFD